MLKCRLGLLEPLRTRLERRLDLHKRRLNLLKRRLGLPKRRQVLPARLLDGGPRWRRGQSAGRGAPRALLLLRRAGRCAGRRPDGGRRLRRGHRAPDGLPQPGQVLQQRAVVAARVDGAAVTAVRLRPTPDRRHQQRRQHQSPRTHGAAAEHREQGQLKDRACTLVDAHRTLQLNVRFRFTNVF